MMNKHIGLPPQNSSSSHHSIEPQNSVEFQNTIKKPLHLALDELKIKAKKQLKALRAQVSAEQSPQNETPSLSPLKLKDIQHRLSKQLGFSDFNQARRVLSGQLAEERQIAHTTDKNTQEAKTQGTKTQGAKTQGALWYGKGSSKFANQWFSQYEEALAIQHQNGLFLLPYKHQFLLVGEAFLTDLGLDDFHIQLLAESGKNMVAIHPSPLWDSLAQKRIRQLIHA